MTDGQLYEVAIIAFLAGSSGAFVAGCLVFGAIQLWGWVIGLTDKQARINDARWRARWQGFLTEAREQGLQGREAVLWAANAMRTHRQALRLLA